MTAQRSYCSLIFKCFVKTSRTNKSRMVISRMLSLELHNQKKFLELRNLVFENIGSFWADFPVFLYIPDNFAPFCLYSPFLQP